MAHADDDYAAFAVLDVNYCGYFADDYCLWPEFGGICSQKTKTQIR